MYKLMDIESRKIRYFTSHVTALIEFVQQLSDAFPACSETKDVLTYLRNCVQGDKVAMETTANAWCDNMLEPLQKGCAKYAKAIECITGQPAVIYHACAFRDITAMNISLT